MTCPHCQKELPENYSALWCPFCGQNLSLDQPPKESPPIKFNRWLFLCALLFPPVLTLISAMAMRSLMVRQLMGEGVSPLVGLVGGGIGGIICGVMLGLQSSRNPLIRVMLSILMSAIMVVVCIMLCFFGCTVGGYQFRLD
jgi:hypothetical protein